MEQGRKTIIFTTFKESGNIIKNGLEKTASKLGYTIGSYLGDDSQAQRNTAKDLFTSDPKMMALVMSIKVGGTGVDFPNVANDMIINDFDWTPEQATQSEGRAYRINTNQDVNVSYVISHNTLDQDLFNVVQKKRSIASIVEKYQAKHGLGSVEEDKEIEGKLKELSDDQKALDRIALEAVRGEMAKIKGIHQKANWYGKNKLSK
jgi:SNF2 family DNA or RNA helicase